MKSQGFSFIVKFMPQINGRRCFQDSEGRKSKEDGVLRDFRRDFLNRFAAKSFSFLTELKSLGDSFMESNNQIAAQSSFPNRKSRQFLSVFSLIGLLALMSGIVAGTNSVTSASFVPQAAITGEWTAEVSKEKSDTIHFTLNRQTGTDHGNFGTEMSLAEFQGLTREQASGANKSVRFRLAREAGTFDFEGMFRDGRGAGVWTLTPSQSFIGEMRSRGFDNLSEERLVASAMLDVRVKTVDDLKAAGFNNLSMEDVIKATIFHVTPEFISELKSIGFENLGLEDLVKTRIFKIDAAFAREVQAMGFGRESLESLVKLRIFKVTPEFLREMKTAGLDNLSIEDLVKLRIFKIDSDFIARAKASGQTDLDVEDLVRMRIHGRAR
jgi:hypothetical protein